MQRNIFITPIKHDVCNMFAKIYIFPMLNRALNDAEFTQQMGYLL